MYPHIHTFEQSWAVKRVCATNFIVINSQSQLLNDDLTSFGQHYVLFNRFGIWGIFGLKCLYLIKDQMNWSYSFSCSFPAYSDIYLIYPFSNFVINFHSPSVLAFCYLLIGFICIECVIFSLLLKTSLLIKWLLFLSLIICSLSILYSLIQASWIQPFSQRLNIFFNWLIITHYFPLMQFKHQSP